MVSVAPSPSLLIPYVQLVCVCVCSFVAQPEARAPLDWELPSEDTAIPPPNKAAAPPPVPSVSQASQPPAASAPAEDLPDRPTTSRRVANPAVSQFFDYVVPSPTKEPSPSFAVQSLVLDEPASAAPEPTFRANRPQPLEPTVVTEDAPDAPLSTSGVCIRSCIFSVLALGDACGLLCAAPEDIS
jgi:hypothetical protein